jgi:hypothetical protein
MTEEPLLAYQKEKKNKLDWHLGWEFGNKPIWIINAVMCYYYY